VLVLETGFAITAFLTLVLNLMLPEEIEDEEAPEITADAIDEEADKEEWHRIRKSKELDVENRPSSEITPAAKQQQQ
jgi:uric acid-xanthine permease